MSIVAVTTVSENPRPADVLLSDGALAIVRPVRPDDGPALYELHDRVADDTVWLRFFSVSRQAGRQYLDKVLSSTDTIALVAEVDGRIAALATAEPTGTDLCEVAFLVADEHRGRGLGTLLLEHLVADARDRGVAMLEARVLRANHRMLEVFEDAGFHMDRHVDGGEEVLRMRTAVTYEIQAAADRREFAAERKSLAPLLAPRGVVVYGARRDGTGIGGTVIAAITGGGYRGSLVVVHPSCPSIRGLSVYRSASEAGVALDLAVIAVPAEGVIAAMEDAAAAGVRAAVVISSGFGEMGERGATLQQDLLTTARRHGIRLVGPNGLGMISNDPRVRLHATFGGLVPASGGVAMASQSGGVGIALMDLLAKAGVGLRYFVSLGNKADVSGNDLLAAWYDDDDVTCAALYLESFGNARKFARFARTFSERKPLVAVVGGRSVGGRRAGSSHTAAAASPAAGVRALFAQAGVIACQDAEELADTTVLLTRAPLPAGNRVAIVSNAGGMGVLAADLAADEQLEVVEFSPGLREQVGQLVNQTTGTANPVDAGAGAEPEQIAGIADAVVRSGEVDAVVAVLVATGTNDLGAAADALATVHRSHPDTPMIVVPLGGPAVGASDIPAFGSSAGAIGALGRVARYAGWRRIERQEPEPSDPAQVRRTRSEARSMLAVGTSDG
jgi:acyl-CoA synthetase (NDP forming)/GNAT superfamily N-acetyltransferase